MAATGKTPILLYGSTTPTNAPAAGNLTNSSDGCEIAINVADKNLFFKDSTNAVNTVPIRQSSASSNGWLSSTDWSTFNGKQPAGSYAVTNAAQSFTGNQTFNNNVLVPSGTISVGSSTAGMYLDVFNGTADAQRVRITTSGTDGVILATRGAGTVPNLIFKIQNTEGFRLTNAGDLSVTNNLVIGTSGKGIDFSATSDGSGTATSELLADYEEGTFTPVVNGSTTTGTGTYSIQLGRYTKIGNVVNFYINLAWSAHTGTGNFNPISGLPYTAANVTNNYSALAVYTSALGMTAGNTIQAVTVPNTSTVVLRQVPTGGGFSVVIPLDAAVDNLIITGSYQTT